MNLKKAKQKIESHIPTEMKDKITVECHTCSKGIGV